MSVSAMTMAMLLTGAGDVQPASAPPPFAFPMTYPPAPPPSPPPRRGPAPAQRARRDLNSYFSMADYPARARRGREEGVVGFHLGIDPNGRVRDCTITRSSGSPSLDAGTCLILRGRARYVPAVTAAGTPVNGSDDGHVTWRLPPEGAPPPLRPPGTPGAYPYPILAAPPPPPLHPPVPRPPGAPPQRHRANLSSYVTRDDYPAAALRGNEEGVTGVRLTVGADGRVSDCSVTASSGSSALDQATCRILRSRARYAPALDAAGQPASGTDNARIRWTLPRD